LVVPLNLNALGWLSAPLPAPGLLVLKLNLGVAIGPPPALPARAPVPPALPPLPKLNPTPPPPLKADTPTNVAAGGVVDAVPSGVTPKPVTDGL
jgi:hypothetical protein